MKKIVFLITLLISMLNVSAQTTTFVPSNRNIVIDSVKANVPYVIPDTLKFVIGQDTIVGLYNLNFTVAKPPKTDTVTITNTVTVEKTDTVKVVDIKIDTIKVVDIDTVFVVEKVEVIKKDTVFVNKTDTAYIVPKNFRISID